jgi:hypothetical protein
MKWQQGKEKGQSRHQVDVDVEAVQTRRRSQSHFHASRLDPVVVPFQTWTCRLVIALTFFTLAFLHLSLYIDPYIYLYLSLTLLLSLSATAPPPLDGISNMDPPPGAEHLPSPLPLPEFSASFPLPFRVLFLVGLAILLWALNLHVLGLLGLDVSWVLDIRDSDDADLGDGSRGADGGFNGSFDDNHGDEKPASSPRPLTPNRFVGPTRAPGAHLAGPVYRLFLIYAAWCTGGWIVFRVLTGSDTGAMERLRGVVGLVCLGPVLAALLPLRGAAGLRERQALRRALWRCINPPADAPIYFCDVILADIATSFAKVLGDLYVSAHQVVFGGITHGRVAQLGVGKWITLGMVW